MPPAVTADDAVCLEVPLLVPLPVTFAAASRSTRRDVAADAAVGGEMSSLFLFFFINFIN